MTLNRRRFMPLVVAAAFLSATAARADEITVLTSGGFAAALQTLVPGLERATRTKVVVSEGSTVANGPTSIPGRLQAGNAADVVDVVIMAASGLDQLMKEGRIAAGSRVDLARSAIGMAVRAGSPKPDISSVEALKRTLLAAKSIAYSSSVSGVYLTTELFPRLGIAEQVAGKSMRIERERVAAVVARGEAEIGFQQVSELLPVPGVAFVGPLPQEVQRVTTFAAGVAAKARNPELARAAIAFLASPSAREAVAKSGLEPIQAARDAGASLVGAWRLVSWEDRLADGTTRRNARTVGSLIYSDTGRMCAVIMDPNRPVWRGRPQDAEVRTAYDGLVAYCGAYELHAAEGFVVHQVDIEKSPAIVGVKRKRWFTFDGPNRLVLRIDQAELQNTTAESRLIWERVTQ